MRLNKKTPQEYTPPPLSNPGFELKGNNPEEQKPVTDMSVIGPKIKLVGELTGDEDLSVQGQFEGSISLNDHHLVIGPNGNTKASVTAKAITVEGKIEGDMEASELISIKDKSLVVGHVKAHRINIEDGAQFQGDIEM